MIGPWTHLNAFTVELFNKQLFWRYLEAQKHNHPHPSFFIVFILLFSTDMDVQNPFDVTTGIISLEGCRLA